MSVFQGIWVPVVTPFQDGAIVDARPSRPTRKNIRGSGARSIR